MTTFRVKTPDFAIKKEIVYLWPEGLVSSEVKDSFDFTVPPMIETSFHQYLHDNSLKHDKL